MEESVKYLQEHTRVAIMFGLFLIAAGMASFYAILWLSCLAD